MVADKRPRRPLWIDGCAWPRETSVLSGLCMCDFDVEPIVFTVVIGLAVEF
jgi:hypothetical protein